MPKISQFPAGGAAQNTDLIPIVRNGGDYTVSGYNLASLASYGQAYVGTFTATAGQTVFTLPASPGSLANLFISVDGAVMVPGSDYTWTTPVTLTFAVGLKVGQTVLYNYTTSVPIGTSLAGGVSGQVQYNNSGVLNGTTIGGDATLVATTGALTVTKTNGVAFAASATTDTTNAANISSGILPVARQSYTQGGTGSVARTVTNKLQESVSVKDFGAVGDGVTDDTAAIQAAFNSIPAVGGNIFIPAGTYKLTGTGLTFFAKSNAHIYGAGMGATILDGSAVTGGSPNAVIVLGYASGAPSPAVLHDVTLRDFSIKGSGSATTGNIINYRGINNITFARLEVSKGYREGIYCDGVADAFHGLIVKDCYFHDCFAQLSNGVNTNTIGVRDIEITGNRFENMATGVYILGENINISGNFFNNISNAGIGVGESNFTARRSISNCVVSNNTFLGLGKSLVSLGGYAFTTCWGIHANGISQAYADQTQDSGIIIANNSFKESYSDYGVSCLYLTGNVKAIGNYCSGLQTTTNSSSIFIFAVFGSDSGSYVGVNGSLVRIHLENNILEKKLSGLNFNFGIFAVSTNNAELECKNNFIDAANQGAQFSSASNGFLPLVTLCGDIIMPSCRLADLAGTDIGTGTTQIALYGTNSTNFRTMQSRDTSSGNGPGRVLSGATPSVAKGSLFSTLNSVATTITNLVRATTNAGEEITIYVNDANTTFQNNGNIKLAGGVDYVAALGAVITFYRPYVTSLTLWVEKCRKT